MTQSQRYPKPHHKHHVLRCYYSSPTMPDEHSYHALDALSDEDLTYKQFLSGISAGLAEIDQEDLDFLGDLQLEATPPGPRHQATSTPRDALGPLP